MSLEPTIHSSRNRKTHKVTLRWNCFIKDQPAFIKHSELPYGLWLVNHLQIPLRFKNYISEFKFFVIIPTIRLFIPANNNNSPSSTNDFRKKLRFLNLLNPSTHIAFASDLYADCLPFSYSQYIKDPKKILFPPSK